MTGTLLLAAGALAGILLAFALATWLSLRNVGRGSRATGAPAAASAASPARAARPRRDPSATPAAASPPTPASRLRSAE